MSLFVFYSEKAEQETPVFWCTIISCEGSQRIVKATHTFEQKVAPHAFSFLELTLKGEFVCFSTHQEFIKGQFPSKEQPVLPSGEQLVSVPNEKISSKFDQLIKNEIGNNFAKKLKDLEGFKIILIEDTSDSMSSLLWDLIPKADLKVEITNFFSKPETLEEPCDIIGTDDIQTIIKHANCTYAKAVETLKIKGNVIDAILELTP